MVRSDVPTAVAIPSDTETMSPPNFMSNIAVSEMPLYVNVGVTDIRRSG